MEFLMDCKIIKDSIYGQIELHPLLIKIIDTPQFQRLRCLQQLGGLYRVYPGATHKRFEHCIGVCHLAGEFVNQLRIRQKSLNITQKDKLCVEIAGLCHDLGHGPYSHAFDKKFLPSINEKGKKKVTHEDISISMFQHMLESNNLIEEFKKYELDEQDIIFIKEAIDPKVEHYSENNWPFKERKIEKCFLLQIVANKQNGIDVDKFDYFTRDCHHLGINILFDHHRLIKLARVIKVEESNKSPINHICFRTIEADNLYDLFYSRQSIYRRACFHKTTFIIEEMLAEGLLLANKYLEIEGKDGKKFRISDACSDMDAYEKLTDNIFYQILHSTDVGLEPARAIYRRIEIRDLYKLIGQTYVNSDNSVENENAKEILATYSKKGLKAKDFVLKILKFDYGMKDKNPIDSVWFYTKEDPDRPINIQNDKVSKFLPTVFCEYVLRVYCKKSDDQNVIDATRCFNEYCKNVLQKK